MNTNLIQIILQKIPTVIATIYNICIIQGLIRFVPLQFSTFGDLPLQFNYLESCHYNSRIHSPRPFCTPRAPWTHLQATVFAYCPHCPWPTRIQARLGLLPPAAPIRASLSPPGSPPRTLDPQPPAVRTTVVAGDPALLRRRRASRSARRGARLLGSWNPRFLGTQ